LVSLPRIRLFLLDMDGTSYLGSTPIPGLSEFLNLLRARSISFLFFTNNSSKSSADYRRKLAKMGIQVEKEHIITSGQATAAYLKRQGDCRGVYLIGTESLRREFEAEGIPLEEENPDYVVLGFDTSLTYEKIRKGCDFIRGGARFIATHPDILCPSEEGPLPDCGAMTRMFVAATGVEPLVIGKPHKEMVEMALATAGGTPETTAIVGDRLYTDIRMGKEAGITTILVLSGETRKEMIKKSKWKPDYVFGSIADLKSALEEGGIRPYS